MVKLNRYNSNILLDMEVSINMEKKVFTSLDIGTTSIKVVVSELDNNKLKVIGVGNAESKGLKRGMIVDIDATVQAIQKAVNKASEKTGVMISNLIVGVPSNGVSIEPCHGVITVSDRSSEITIEDVNNVVNQSIANIVPPERDLLSVTLEEFIVDGFDEINDPRSMVGQRLEMYGTAISVPKTILHNIKRCVEKAGFNIAGLVLQPEALAKVALTQDERNFGTVLIDIGGGQTTVSAIHDDQVKFASVVQEGGDFITKDISIVLNTSTQNADQLKKEVGAIQGDSRAVIEVNVVGQDEPAKIKESYIGEIIEARIAQIFDKIKADLDPINALQLPGGVVLSGGTASIPGVTDLAEDIFDVRTEKYIPDYMGIRTPAFSVAIGLALYQAQTTDIQREINKSILRQAGIQSVEEQNQRQIPQPSQQVSDYQYDDNEYDYSDQSIESKSSDQFIDKIKNFFTNFFE